MRSNRRRRAVQVPDGGEIGRPCYRLDLRSVSMAATIEALTFEAIKRAGKVIHDVAAPAETASEGIIRLKGLIHNQASVISALFGRRDARIIAQDSNKTRVFHQ